MVRILILLSFLLLFCIPASATSNLVNGVEQVVGFNKENSNQGSAAAGINVLKHSTDVQKVTISKLDCAPGKECRLMFVYNDFSECKLPESWKVEEGHKAQSLSTSNGKDQHGQSSSVSKNIETNYQSNSNAYNEIRQQIMRIFERRINNAIQQKHGNSIARFTPFKKQGAHMKEGSKIVSKVEEDTWNYDYGDDENTNSHSQSFKETSVRIQTRYLKSLSMEIVVIPEGLTTDEAINLTTDLPCIELVSPDYVKRLRPSDDSMLSSPSSLKQQASTVIDQTEFTASSQERISYSNNQRKQHAFSNLRASNSVKARRNGDTLSENNKLQDFEDHGIKNRSPHSHVNDPVFPLQWYLDPNEPHGLKTDILWNNLQEFPETTVAVIDSGCDMNHPDLNTQFWTNPDEICGDGIDNDGNGYIDDCHGWDFVENDNTPIPSPSSSHGTEVSGIIAARFNNSIGISGLFPNCKIMCLRFISETEGRITDEVAAIDYAVTKGVRISNNSYGAYGGAPVEMKAIQRAQRSQHLFVAAAGNEDKDTDQPENFFGPACYPLDNILSVGSYDKQGERSSFSNYGKTTVDLLAPGSTIVTTSNSGTYSSVSGTSFAAPIATATAAAIWSKYPRLSYTNVINSMIHSCNRENIGLKEWTRCEGLLDFTVSLELAGMIATGNALMDQAGTMLNS